MIFLLFKQKTREAEAAGEMRYVQEEDIAALSRDEVHGNLERLRNAEMLTGEWIVFAKHGIRLPVSNRQFKACADFFV